MQILINNTLISSASITDKFINREKVICEDKYSEQSSCSR